MKIEVKATYMVHKEIALHKNLQWYFIERLYRTLKNIACITGLKNCYTCSYYSKCTYYKLSGNDFKSFNIPIQVCPNLYGKKYYEPNEILEINFTINEDVVQYFEFIQFILQNLFSNISKEKNVLSLLEISNREVEIKNSKNNKITELPVYSLIIDNQEFRDKYNINDNLYKQIMISLKQKEKIVLPEFSKINGEKIQLKGTQYSIDLTNIPVNIKNYFIENGLSKYSFLGFGILTDEV